jgi:hypothetical protein
MSANSMSDNPAPSAPYDQSVEFKRRMINGSRAAWRLSKGSVIGLLAMLWLFNFVSSDRRISMILSLFALLFWVASAHGIVCGFIERDGIRYKTYFRWKMLRWEDVEGITQPTMGFHAFSILVRIRGESFLNRNIYFSPNPLSFGTLKSSDASLKDLTRAWLAGL